MSKDKEQYYLNIAQAVAEGSTCYLWKAGAIVVSSKGNIVGIGYNGMPCDEDSCADKGYCPYEKRHGRRPNGDTQQCDGVHAEMKAMINASQEKMTGGTMYVYIEDRKTGQIMTPEIDTIDSRIVRSSGIKQLIYGEA